MGADELPGKANYFLGNDPSKWRTNIPTYAKVRYESIYPGVDLVYYGTQGGELEYDFVVAPRADPRAITLGIETQGHAPLRINSQGNLVVPLPSGSVQLHRPVVYQIDGGVVSSSAGSPAGTHGLSKVEGHYALEAHNRVRFELGPYDYSRPLVIDPVLSYATYVGGSGGDVGYAIAVDTSLDAYVAGVTNSSNFPTQTAYQGGYKGNGDCFVFKINSTGTALLYSTFLGGSQSDSATAIALSAGNSVFITGNTDSLDFPVVAPPTSAGPTYPFQQTYGGNTDAFVAQLGATGGTLYYSTYLGGNGADFGQGIAVDSSGNAYVTGATQSPNFPVTAGTLQPNIAGSQNAFVTKVNATGEALVYSTYLGGSATDVGQSIQVDSSGDAYVAGYTFSTNFPLVGPFQKVIGGGSDAFVAEINPAGSALTFSTYLGGSGNDYAYGLALDGSKNIYLTGSTGSTNFPIVSGAFQPALKGSSNAFVSKLNPAGSSLLYSTYLGGSGNDQGKGIAVTSAGVAFVTGSTNSTDFPTLNPVQATLGLSSAIAYCGTAPCPDAFITQLNAAGNGLNYSTYLGGNGYDSGQSIALDSTGDPYITGSTASTNFPAAAPPNSVSITPTPYKSTLTGTAGNSFVAKIDSANNPNISIVPASLNFGNETISISSPLQEIYLTNMSTVPLTITEIQVPEVNLSTTVFTETDNCVGTLPPGGAYCTMYVGFTPNMAGLQSGNITITDNAGGVAGTEQNIAVSGTGTTAATSVTVTPTSLSFPSQSVGTISPAQQVTVTNTGTQTLNITKISAGTTGDYSETDNCLSAPNNGILSEGGICTVKVFFSPTASGTRTGSLTISDNATGSPQSVSLTGIGAAAFTLSTPSAVNPVLIGADQTTFVIEANGPTGANAFGGAISLTCSAGTLCTFSTNPIFASGGAGSTTTMTVQNLTTTMPNPYTFSVTGTSGSQSYTLPLSLGFMDYTLTATPSSDTIPAGAIATYYIYMNPLNDFNTGLYGQPNQAIILACATSAPQFPPDATCNWSNYEPTPTGTNPTSVTLTIQTQKYVTPTYAPPRFPNLPPIIFGLLSLAGLASLAFGNRRRARRGWLGSGWLGVRLATLSLILALNLALTACRASTLVISGTTSGNYTITISGTLASNNVVVRYTTLNLSVTASPIP
jgi:hypothetical protein